MLTLAAALRERGTNRDLQEAVGIYLERLAIERRGSDPWSRVCLQLGLTFEELATRSTNPVSYLRHAARYLRDALDGELDAELRALVRVELAATLARLERATDRTETDISDHLAAAKRALPRVRYPDVHEEIEEIEETVQARANGLVVAAERGDIARVTAVLAAGEPIDTTDREGCTALHLAVGEGHLQLATMLVECGADTSLRDALGFSVLHWAVVSRSTALCELAASHVPIDAVDQEGRTPFSWAASVGGEACLLWLLERGAEPERADHDGWRPIHHAVSARQLDCVRCLLDRGVRADELAISLAREPGAEAILAELQRVTS